MRRKSVFVLFIGIWLSGCAFIQEIGSPQPAPTGEIERAVTLTPSSVPDTPAPKTTLTTPAPSTTRVLATAPFELTPATTLTGQSVQPQTALETSRYVLQSGSPRWLPNFSHPDMGCNFLGVAGQVFDPQGTPEKMLIIEAGGTLAGNDVFALSLTGNDSNYGPGGYELILSDQLVPSSDSVWIQVFNLQGQALSEKTYLDTFSDCQRNLVLINFVESSFVGAPRALHLPFILKNFLVPKATPAP